RPRPTKEREKNPPAVIADIAFGRGNPGTRKQFAQGRHEHQGVNERIHSVERPASPRGPESADLIPREWSELGELRFRMDFGGGHVGGTISKAVEEKSKIEALEKLHGSV